MTVKYAWGSFNATWNCTILDVHTGDESAVALDEDHSRIRLNAAGGWQTFSCKVRVDTEEKAPNGLGALQAFALVTCAKSQTRLPFKLEPECTSSFVGQIDFAETDMAGLVTISVEITAVAAGRLRSVGRSTSWTVVLDPSDAPAPPGAPPFSTSWIDFAADDSPELTRAAPKAHAVMDLSGKPTLLLNKGLDGFQALVQADTAKLERRRLRDLLGSNIARYSLATIFREAAVEVMSGDNGEPMTLENPLQRQVFESVGAAIPSLSGVAELYSTLATQSELTPRERAQLWVQIDLAIDSLTDVSVTWATVCEEVKRGLGQRPSRALAATRPAGARPDTDRWAVARG